MRGHMRNKASWEGSSSIHCLATPLSTTLFSHEVDESGLYSASPDLIWVCEIAVKYNLIWLGDKPFLYGN